MNRKNLIWWVLALIVAITLWRLYETVPSPGEMRWEILEDLKFRFPVPHFPQPWRH